MKIYIAATEPHGLRITKWILLSFYDIYISSLPFRKETFKVIKNENKQRRTTRSLNHCQTRVI